MVTSVTHKRIVGYIRVSTDRQAGEDHHSLDTQEERIRSKARDSGGLLLKIFRDVDSGRKDDRPEYRQMLRYIHEEGIDLVLVQYLDRFGRNPKEILSRIWELGGRGVTVRATDQDIQDDLMLLVSAGVAGHESKRISERVRVNMASSARKGVHNGPPPYGYQPIREIKDGQAVTTGWEIVKEEAAIVKEMARLSSDENFGFKAIADNLNDRGMTRNGRHWVPASVQKILQNPVYTGLLVYGKSWLKENPNAELIEVPGVFPRILSDQEWQTLQKRMAIRRGAPRGSVHRSNYLLSGIAKCGHCDGPMTGKTGGKHKGKPYRSYQCVRAKKTRAYCEFHNSHSARRLEPAILEHLGQYSDPKRVEELLQESGAKELKRKQKELTQTEKQLAALDADFHKNLGYLKKEILTEEEFSAANAKRRDVRARTEIRLAELREEVSSAEAAEKAIVDLPERIASFAEAFEQVDVPKAKAMLQMILKAAYVWNDGRVELEFR